MVPLAWQTGSRRPGNVWLGTTVESEPWARRRIPHLQDATWPAERFLSIEPLLDPPPALTPWPAGVGWVLLGGESGPKRDDLDMGAAMRIAEQARAAGAAVFVKQDSGPYPGRRGRLSEAMWSLKEFPR
jgi:protein gp37